MLPTKHFLFLGECRSKKQMNLATQIYVNQMKNTTPSGNRYFTTLIDDFTRFCAVFLLKSKSEAELKIRQYVRWTENMFGRKPQLIRSVCRSSTTPKAFSRSILPHICRNRMEWLRGRFAAYRRWPTVCCWTLGCGEAILTANFVQNRLPSLAMDKTPFELWMDRVPDLAKLEMFGCEALVHVPGEKRKNFDSKSTKLVFIAIGVPPNRCCST